MSKRHLKSLNAPRSWPIERKKDYWTIRPNPGPHSFRESISIGVIFTHLLKYTKNTREVKKLLNEGVVSVNGKVVKEKKFPVGIFDVIELKDGECYRLYYNQRGKFVIKEINRKEKDIFIYKVSNKTMIKGGKLQLNLKQGNNFLTKNKEINTGDSVIMQGKEIKNILKLGKGSFIYLTGGKHIGHSGTVESIDERKIVFSKDKEKLETLKKYAFVVGEKNPLITL